MPRIASIALMASMAFGTVYLVGCDKEKSETETKTTSSDGSKSMTDKVDKVTSDGTVKHTETTTDKPADATTKP